MSNIVCLECHYGYHILCDYPEWCECHCRSGDRKARARNAASRPFIDEEGTTE